MFIKGNTPDKGKIGLGERIYNIETIMGGIIIVFFVAFLGMLVSYFALLSDNWRHKEDVYYQLLEKVNQNNCGFIKIE